MSVEPNFREVVDCGCGCGEQGTAKAPWRDGSVCVQRKCRCPRCRGKANRRAGKAKQRTARKRLGVPQSKFGDPDEERWADELFANEVKAGAQVRPAATAFLRIEKQAFANRADHGDRLRPCRGVIMPAGWGSDGLVMVRLSTWEQVVRPALDAFYQGETL